MIDIAHLSPWLLLVAPIVVLVAYTVFGLSGFGSTVIAVPILAHFLPIAYLVPLMAVLDVVSATFIGTSSREHVAKSELKHLFPFIFVGFAIGATVLVSMPEAYLRAALGVFALAVGVNSIVNPVLHRTISQWWCIPAGITGGSIAAVFGAGGPIYITYLSGRLKDKDQIRATISTLISISAFTRAVVYAVTGLLFNTAIFAGLIVLSPFVWLGLRTGNRIHVGLSHTQMRRVIGTLLSLVGLSLLIRVFI
jgi:uncharacterized membrane protein YfcA